MIATPAAIAACVHLAAGTLALPEPLLWSIMKAEGGHVGQAVRNTNGSYDLGPMQINDRTWLPVLSRAYQAPAADIRSALLNDACFNIRIGAWVLRQALDENPDAGFWEGVARYNTHSNSLKHRYQLLVAQAARGLYGDGVFRGQVQTLPPGLWNVPVMKDALRGQPPAESLAPPQPDQRPGWPGWEKSSQMMKDLVVEGGMLSTEAVTSTFSITATLAESDNPGHGSTVDPR